MDINFSHWACCESDSSACSNLPPDSRRSMDRHSAWIRPRLDRNLVCKHGVRAGVSQRQARAHLQQVAQDGQFVHPVRAGQLDGRGRASSVPMLPAAPDDSSEHSIVSSEDARSVWRVFMPCIPRAVHFSIVRTVLPQPLARNQHEVSSAPYGVHVPLLPQDARRRPPRALRARKASGELESMDAL